VYNRAGPILAYFVVTVEVPVPSPRFERLDPEKREALLDAARAEFAENGFDASSYNSIIAKSGFGKGSFYYYFHGKEDLYLTVLRDAIVRLSEAMGVPAEVNTADEFWSEWTRLYHRLLEFGVQNPVLVTLLGSALDWTSSLLDQEVAREVMAKDIEWGGRMILQGQQLGAVRDDIEFDLLLAIVSAVIQAEARWGLHRWVEAEPEALGEHADMMVDIFRRIATPAQPSGGDGTDSDTA
jgi:AcrR family transcriptional regulator